MKRLFILMGILFIFTAGCKKEIQEPTSEETPVFHFNGNVNASLVNLQAGVNDYYMYSFFKQDSVGFDGLYSFWGNIKQVNCTQCTNHISFKINDSKLSAIGGTASIDTALMLGKYTYVRDTTLAFKKTVAFTAYSSPGDTVQSYSWNFGDGTTSKLQNPVHTYNAGNYSACLEITYKNGCWGASCNPVIVGPNNGDECSVSIIDTAEKAGNGVSLHAISKTVSPVSYSWNFGDSISGSNNVSNLKDVYHDFSAPGIYRVSVQISNTGCTTGITKNIATPNYTTGCFANYGFTIFPNNQLPFSKITVYWKDSAGITYSSENIFQPADSFFEILSVDEYRLNENKQRTKKIHAKLKCRLSDGKSIITVTDGDAIFAISYP
jgi:PKD repeat protein